MTETSAYLTLDVWTAEGPVTFDWQRGAAHVDITFPGAHQASDILMVWEDPSDPMPVTFEELIAICHSYLDDLLNRGVFSDYVEHAAS